MYVPSRQPEKATVRARSGICGAEGGEQPFPFGDDEHRWASSPPTARRLDLDWPAPPPIDESAGVWRPLESATIPETSLPGLLARAARRHSDVAPYENARTLPQTPRMQLFDAPGIEAIASARRRDLIRRAASRTRAPRRSNLTLFGSRPPPGYLSRSARATGNRRSRRLPYASSSSATARSGSAPTQALVGWGATARDSSSAPRRKQTAH